MILPIKKIYSKFSTGFSILELLVVIAVIGLLTVGILYIFVNFRNSKALSTDTELVVEILRQAQGQTLNSQDENQYGVHIGTSQIILFTGSTYVSGASGNVIYPLTSRDTVVTITLTGSGSDVIFQRLTGETTDNGTIVLTSASTSLTKTVTVYKTGLVESN